MTITKTGQLTLKAEITPADQWSSGKYSIGPNGETISIPAACDMAVSANMTLASGSERNYEPDVHTFNGTALRDPDGNTVSIDTVYAIVLKNDHATVSASYLTANITSVPWGGVLQPGGIGLLFLPAGVAVQANSTLGLTGISGTPNVSLTLFGAAT